MYVFIDEKRGKLDVRRIRKERNHLGYVTDGRTILAGNERNEQILTTYLHTATFKKKENMGRRKRGKRTKTSHI